MDNTQTAENQRKPYEQRGMQNIRKYTVNHIKQGDAHWKIILFALFYFTTFKTDDFQCMNAGRYSLNLNI